MTGILGPEGFERYTTLWRKTAATRRRIEWEGWGEFRQFYDVLDELAGTRAATVGPQEE